MRRSNRVPSKSNAFSTLCQPTSGGRRCGRRSRSTYRNPIPSTPSIHLCEPRGHGMDAARLDVDGKRAGLLDGVHHEQHVAIPAKLPDGLHVRCGGRLRTAPSSPRPGESADRWPRRPLRESPRRPPPGSRAASRLCPPDASRRRRWTGTPGRLPPPPRPPGRQSRPSATVARPCDVLFTNATSLAEAPMSSAVPRPRPGRAFPPRARSHVAPRHVVVEPGVDGHLYARRTWRHCCAVEVDAVLAGRKRAAVLLAQGRHGSSLHGRLEDTHCMGKQPRMGKQPPAHVCRWVRRASASRCAM